MEMAAHRHCPPITGIYPVGGVDINMGLAKAIDGVEEEVPRAAEVAQEKRKGIVLEDALPDVFSTQAKEENAFLLGLSESPDGGADPAQECKVRILWHDGMCRSANLEKSLLNDLAGALSVVA